MTERTPSELPPEPEVWELANGKYVIPVIAYDTMREYAIKVRDERDQKEADRQYHMNAINRLAKFLGFWGTSDAVIDAATDNMKRFARELSTLRTERDAAMAVVDMVLDYARTGSAGHEMIVAARAAKDKVGT